MTGPTNVIGTCPRCNRPLVFRANPYGEPTCWDDDCGWSASDGGWDVPWAFPAADLRFKVDR